MMQSIELSTCLLIFVFFIIEKTTCKSHIASGLPFKIKYESISTHAPLPWRTYKAGIQKALHRYRLILFYASLFLLYHLSLHKVLLIPHKKCINGPHFSPVIGISSHIIIKNRLNLFYIEELLCHFAAEFCADILIVAVICHPNANRYDKAKFFAERDFLRQNFCSRSTQCHLILHAVHFIFRWHAGCNIKNPPVCKRHPDFQSCCRTHLVYIEVNIPFQPNLNVHILLSPRRCPLPIQ